MLLGLLEPEPEPEPDPAVEPEPGAAGLPDGTAGPFPDDLGGGDRGRFLWREKREDKSQEVSIVCLLMQSYIILCQLMQADYH